ncbi:hypothetical protein QBC41DRAFT_383850 [Cercophora samala]|uniref:Uncharacterized protein n=1 Tax=Cercophora samala TaxID=330535 RepID=A0AA40DF20_9PEZI|nr:hypothetical protein QBC41DRAFT_383850 [Cercophora samala]
MGFRLIAAVFSILYFICGISLANPLSRRTQPSDASVERLFNGAAGILVDTKDASTSTAQEVSGTFVLPLKGTKGDDGVTYSNASFGIYYGGDRYGTHDTDSCGASATVGAGVDMHVNSDGTASFSAWSWLWDGEEQMDWIDLPLGVQGGDKIYVQIKKFAHDKAWVQLINKNTEDKYESLHKNIGRGLCQAHVGWLLTEWQAEVDKVHTVAKFGEIFFSDMRWVGSDWNSYYPTSNPDKPGDLWWLIFGGRNDQGTSKESFWQDATPEWRVTSGEANDLRVYRE